MGTLSRTSLLSFLDYLANKGLMNKATVAARKAAVNQVLSILDDKEAQDVSALDLNEVMSRFHNLAGTKYSPGSLGNYRSRVKSAIDDFVRYQKDPVSFKPATPSGGRRQQNRPRDPSVPEATQLSEQSLKGVEAPPTAMSILPIPIRPDLTVKIQGLPYDLTVHEANKIANVVKAMALQD